MKTERPRFELASVEIDEANEAPAIIPVAQSAMVSISRRDFLGIGVSIAAVALAGCTEHLKGRDVVGELAINPNDKTLISSSKNGQINLWSLPEGKRIASFGDEATITALALSSDGNSLAASSTDNTIKLWSLPEGKLLARLEVSTSDVRSLAMAANGPLAAFTGNGTIQLWSLPDGKPLNVLEARGPISGTSALALSSDGKILAFATGGEIKLWSLPDGKLVTTLKEPFSGSGSESALAISPDGKTLASAMSEKINLWFVPEGKLFASLEGHHKARIETLAISTDGATLVSADGMGMIISWNLEQHSFNAVLYETDAPPPSFNSNRSSSEASSGSSSAGGSTSIDNGGFSGGGGRTISGSQPCGMPLPPNAVCTCNCVPVPSDRELKEAFEPTDTLAILQRLADLPIQQWKYHWDDASVRHIGPMAQDFAVLFGVGEDDKHIHPVDAQGVAFAAIQALYRLLKEEAARTTSLQLELGQLTSAYQGLKHECQRLEGSTPHE